MYQSDHDYYGKYACASVHVCVFVGVYACVCVLGTSKVLSIGYFEILLDYC